MPAVQIARLRIQVALLVDYISQPAVFIRRLHDLFNLYTDHTIRPNKTPTASTTLLPNYRLPAPLLRQIESELTRASKSTPGDMFRLADALWQEGYFEIRMLAIHLLGQAPSEPPEEVLTRIKAWVQPGQDPRILDALITSNKIRLQREKRSDWMRLIQGWLEEPSVQVQAIGLRALISVIKNPDFENLPLVFHLLSPFLQSSPPELLPELVSLIKVLIERSPIESAFLLRQALEVNKQSGTIRLVRRCLPFFSADVQDNLRRTIINIHKEMS